MFSGSHLYRSAIFLLVYVQFESGPHLYQSVIILSVQVCVLGPHLYWSIILCVSLSFWGRTYIDRPSSYHFHVSSSLFFEVAPVSIGHLAISLCLVRVRTAPILIVHFLCEFEFLRLHLYRSVIFLYLSMIIINKKDNKYYDLNFMVYSHPKRILS